MHFHLLRLIFFIVLIYIVIHYNVADYVVKDYDDVSSKVMHDVRFIQSQYLHRN
jgi:hypothetical protein